MNKRQIVQAIVNDFAYFGEEMQEGGYYDGFETDADILDSMRMDLKSALVKVQALIDLMEE